jgi:integrase/recombinase XerD
MVFSDADIKALLTWRPTTLTQWRLAAVVQTLLDTGCRINEVLTLRAADVDFENLLMLVDGKGSKQRKVPFSIELRKTLWRYKQLRERQVGPLTGYMFCCRHGQRIAYRNMYRDIINLCTEVGITKRVHCHLARHTFACHFMKNGGSIYTLSRILGHSSVTTTQTYIRGLGVEDFKEEHARLTPLVRSR